MAKIVIAGSADCPYFARVELLADSLSRNLPDFKVHKIVKQPNEWETWLNTTCKKHGWTHRKSPLVWRELIDRGGKGNLIGGANEFQEYAFGYYGVKSPLASDDMTKIGKENLKTKNEIDEEEKEFRAQSKPVKVCITNASSPVCYSMISSLSAGDVLGDDVEVALYLYDSEDVMSVVEGIQMEAFDLAFPLLRDVQVTSDINQAFSNCAAIIILDEMQMQEEEIKDDWIKRNNDHFSAFAKVINSVSLPDVKVIVGGSGPVNFNVSMMIKNAPNIPKQNIVASPRIVENNAKAIISTRLKVNSAGIVDVVVWGNANGKRHVDLSRARVHGYDGAIWGPPSFSVPVKEMIHDDKWLAGEFVELLNKRQETTQEALRHPTAVSQAAAISTLLGHWCKGSPQGQMFSLGVCSEGQYGVPEGLVFCLPVSFSSPGSYTIVHDLEQTEELAENLNSAVKDLQSEEAVIYPPPYAPTPTPPPAEQPPKEENANNSAVGQEAGETDETAGLSKIQEDKEGEAKAERELTKNSKEGAKEADQREEVTERSRSSSQASLAN